VLPVHEVVAVQVHMEAARLLPSVVPGLVPAMAAAVALDAIEQETGLKMEGLRRLLPAAEGPLASLTPTDLGERLGGLTAQKVNKLLKARGLQHRNERGAWELTAAGKAYGEALPYHRNGHSGYRLLWKPEVLDLLRKPAGEAPAAGEGA
jgi:hypothetical protein